MTRASTAAALIAVLALLLPPPAGAETFQDAATGLTVDLPEGFRATRGERPGYDVVIGLNSDAPRRRIGTSADLCQLAYAHAPQNASLSQAQINEISAAPDRLALIRTQMERGFEVASIQPVPWGAATGTEVTGTPRVGPDAPDARVMLSIAETPRGRVVLSCAAHAADTPALYEVFRTLRAAVKPPA
ncbi:hypothetical protein [Muricoccus radiodurans]|uniref:hypothetical protein n=1 Tax=Muricoccus radiodurans TaxID=2231721 RepID=UPI003CE74D5F